tara:strand:- start:311 stop:712 length:402 start_codon:yes stop_codon:yes gene_type:complete
VRLQDAPRFCYEAWYERFSARGLISSVEVSRDANGDYPVAQVKDLDQRRPQPRASRVAFVDRVADGVCIHCDNARSDAASSQTSYLPKRPGDGSSFCVDLIRLFNRQVLVRLDTAVTAVEDKAEAAGKRIRGE